jgi:hypothetical protein
MTGRSTSGFGIEKMTAASISPKVILSMISSHRSFWISGISCFRRAKIAKSPSRLADCGLRRKRQRRKDLQRRRSCGGAVSQRSLVALSSVQSAPPLRATRVKGSGRVILSKNDLRFRRPSDGIANRAPQSSFNFRYSGAFSHPPIRLSTGAGPGQQHQFLPMTSRNSSMTLRSRESD